MPVKKLKYLSAVILIILSGWFAAFAQTTVFSYQGKLIDQGEPANGQYDFEFELFDKPTSGNQLGLNSPTNIEVADGNYTVNLDFGDKFPGAERYIEIRYRQSGSGASFTILTPRQLVTSAPYAIKSLYADKSQTSESAETLGGTPASQFVQTTDSRLSDARTPTPGSNNYIQNTNVWQPASFSIVGSGTVNGTLGATKVNAGDGYYILNQRVVANYYDALSVGVNAGGGNYLGYSRNSFFGTNSGRYTSGGGNNSFFGFDSGGNNGGGGNNSFFGTSSGLSNTSGSYNSFIGESAGWRTTTGFFNTFVGQNSGNINISGNYNTAVGDNANVSTGNLTNASAFGSKAFVAQSNSLVLGSINGVNGANASTNVGIGTTAPLNRLHVVGNALFTDGSTTTTRGDLNLLSSLGNADFYMQGNGNNKGINFGVWSGSAPNATLYISQFDGTSYLDRLTINANGTIGIGTLSSIYGTTRLCLNSNHEIAPCTGGAAFGESNESLQKQIDAQNEVIKRQQAEIEALKRLVCGQNQTAEICQPKK